MRATNDNWLRELFIDEAKSASDRHSSSSESLPLQEKAVTKNGEVTPDKGYSGLSKVVVDILNDDEEVLF